MADILDQEAGSELFASYEAEWKVCINHIFLELADTDITKASPGRNRAEAGTSKDTRYPFYNFSC
jgi:hypothetical protein